MAPPKAGSPQWIIFVYVFNDRPDVDARCIDHFFIMVSKNVSVGYS